MPLYTMEAANLFAGDANPNASQHLTLQELKLPGLEENYVDHTPGGAPVGIEIDTHINRLEATFNLAGWSPEVMIMIGSWEAALQHFTAYGLIRDRLSGVARQATAIIWGRLGRVNPTNFRRGDLQAHEYSIRGITHYELTLEGIGDIYLWDFFTSTRIIGGVNQNADLVRTLQIPGGVAAGGGGGFVNV